MILSWEPEGRYQYSKMFQWEPEGRYRCAKSMRIAPFWLSTDELFSSFLMSLFIFPTGRGYTRTIQKQNKTKQKWRDGQLSARKALSLIIFNDVPLRTRQEGARSPFWFSSMESYLTMLTLFLVLSWVPQL